LFNTDLKKLRNDTGRFVFAANTEKRLDLSRGRLYTGMTLAIAMTYTIADGVVPTGRKFGGALNIFKSLKIKINDSERLVPVNLSGAGILAQHLNDTGRYPNGHTALAAAAGTYDVMINVPLTFGCPAIAGGTGVGIDLTTEAGNPNLFSKAEIIANFGDVTDLYQQADGVTIDSATVDIITHELDVSNRSQHERYPLRYLEDKVVPVVNAQPTEVRLRKTTNSQYVGVSMVALRNGFLSTFDTDKNMSVKHGDETIIDSLPASVLHEIASVARDADYDEGHIRYDFANYAELVTVPRGENLSDDIIFELPTVFTAQDDQVLVVNETLKSWDFG